jgi:glycosyltransferase involved in cell wall biosynthesis
MKIILFSYLFPNKSFPTYGIFNLSRARALKNAGYDVIVIAPISLNPHLEYFYPSLKLKELIKYYKSLISIPKIEFIYGIKVFHPKWIKAPNKIFSKYHANVLHFFIGREIIKIIKNFKADLIISTWLNPFAVYSKYIRKKIKIKFFAIAEGSDVLIDASKFRGLKKTEKTINKNCDLVIAVSDLMKKQMQEKTNLKNIQIIRNGYDQELFFNNGKINFEKTKILQIMHVGGFYYVKGQDLLLKALSYITVPVKLTLIGVGPELEKCQQYVLNHKLGENVQFLGQVSHEKIADLLRVNDLFCMPSRSEGLPAAPLEAMACGLPVVGTNVGGMNEIIKSGFNGYLCEPDSPIDIAEKIMMASQINWNRIEISNWAKNNFSWDTWAQCIIEVYQIPSKKRFKKEELGRLSLS